MHARPFRTSEPDRGIISPGGSKLKVIIAGHAPIVQIMTALHGQTSEECSHNDLLACLLGESDMHVYP